MSDRIGFTGTQQGMTKDQKEQLEFFLFNRSGYFHHGDCIGADKEFKEQLRSGTWSTIRYAKKMKRPITIIYPNGSVVTKSS